MREARQADAPSFDARLGPAMWVDCAETYAPPARPL